METVDRGEPVRRRLVVMRIVAVIAVTDDRGAGVALVRDAVVYAGEHRRYREKGIGVGTARAMLDVAARRRAGGGTEGYGAGVDPPGRKSVMAGQRVSVLVGLGCRRVIKKKQQQ